MAKNRLPLRVTSCAWCSQKDPSYGARARCPRCHVPYSIKLDYMYFVNAVRDVLRIAPLQSSKSRDRRKLAS